MPETSSAKSRSRVDDDFVDAVSAVPGYDGKCAGNSVVAQTCPATSETEAQPQENGR